MNSNPPHPYQQYERTGLWHCVEQAIADLVANQDISELTPRHYIVGYICQHVSKLTDKQNNPDQAQQQPAP